MHKAIFISFLFFLLIPMSAIAQDGNEYEEVKETGNLLFWTAQSWDCHWFTIDIYDKDSTIILRGNLDQRYSGVEIPECGNDQTLNFENLPSGNYYFVADCSKEECSICQGDGSFWQPIVHDQSTFPKKTKSKGDIKGVWKTCTTCGGDGHASTIIWMDTFSINLNQCRSILLK